MVDSPKVTGPAGSEAAEGSLRLCPPLTGDMLPSLPSRVALDKSPNLSAPQVFIFNVI